MKINVSTIIRKSVIIIYIIGAILLGLYIATGNSKTLLLAGLFTLLSSCLKRLENHITKISIEKFGITKVLLLCLCGCIIGVVLKYVILGFAIPIRILISVIMIAIGIFLNI